MFGLAVPRAPLRSRGNDLQPAEPSGTSPFKHKHGMLRRWCQGLQMQTWTSARQHWAPLQPCHRKPGPSMRMRCWHCSSGKCWAWSLPWLQGNVVLDLLFISSPAVLCCAGWNWPQWSVVLSCEGTARDRDYEHIHRRARCPQSSTKEPVQRLAACGAFRHFPAEAQARHAAALVPRLADADMDVRQAAFGTFAALQMDVMAQHADAVLALLVRDVLGLVITSVARECCP